MATKQENENKIQTAFALWNGRGKVAYSGFLKEEVTIPAGAKVIAFQNKDATQENRKPTLSICWVLENKE